MSRCLGEWTSLTQLILEAGDDDATKIETLEFILVSTLDAISRGAKKIWLQSYTKVKLYTFSSVFINLLGTEVSCSKHKD